MRYVTCAALIGVLLVCLVALSAAGELTDLLDDAES
jgi:hypothetical protein